MKYLTGEDVRVGDVAVCKDGNGLPFTALIVELPAGVPTARAIALPIVPGAVRIMYVGPVVPAETALSQWIAPTK